MSMTCTRLVTVAIPFYNSESTLHYAIESVLRQRFQDFDLILLNDGSTDQSVEVARRYLDAGRTILIDDGRNLGLAPRLNQISAAARGKYLARMDADDVMHPERLQRQLAFLESHPHIDLVGTGIYCVDAQYTVLGRLTTPRIRLCHKFSYLRLFHPTVTGRTTWFCAHPYSNKYLRCEDQELWLRAGGGTNITHIAEPLLYNNFIVHFELAKTMRTLRQYEQIVRHHRHRTCLACRIREIAVCRLKRMAYAVLDTAGIIEKARIRRFQKLDEAERGDASRQLQRLLAWAEDRMKAFSDRTEGLAESRLCGI